jgi:WD40 repeat protein
MDPLLLARETGLGRLSRRPEPIWGGDASETLVRKLQLDQGLEQTLASAVNDVSWDCSGSFLASAGDDCILNVYSAGGRLLRSFDPVRGARGVSSARKCCTRRPCTTRLEADAPAPCRLRPCSAMQQCEPCVVPKARASVNSVLASLPSPPTPRPPCLDRPQGHTSSIMALQYVPGSRGAMLLTGGGDKQVGLDGETGLCRDRP